MQAKVFNPFGWTDAPEYRADDLEASKVITLWFPTREASIAHNLSWLGTLPPLQKGFVPSVGQSASERLSSNPPWMFGLSPNIGGGFGYLVAVQNWGINGAFSSGSTEDGSSSFDTTGQHAGVFFSARNSSSIYSGETLQPSALQTLPCIKFWCTAALINRTAGVLFLRRSN